MRELWRLTWEFSLEVLLAISALALCLQLAWPGILLWLAQPRPGQLGIIELPGEEQFIGLATRCLVYLPPHYYSNQPFPVVLYLHGSGARGHDIEKVRSAELPAYLDRGGSYPAIVIAPQCEAQQWNAQSLSNLIDLASYRFKVDRDRVTAVGYSMGGYGAWDLANHAPEKLAGVVSMCGGGDASVAEKLKKLPIWVFHGEQDNVVPLSGSQAIADAVSAAGGTARLTILKDRGHDIAEVAYKNQELIDWLMQQRRSAPKTP